MLSHLTMSAWVLLSGAVLLAAFFGVIYRQKRQAYLLAWTVGWLVAALHFLANAIASNGFAWHAAIGEWFLSIGALIFWCSALLYAQKKVPVNWVAVLAVGTAILAVGNARDWSLVPPLDLFAGFLFFLAAGTFWSQGKKQESRADMMLALTFAVWGLVRFAAAVQIRFDWLSHFDLFEFILLPELFSGALMVMAVYEEERRRVERNMLALSNLNLATSGFIGVEIQKMLAQALDRVLNVARIPAGALVLHDGRMDAPASIVSTGLTEAFCAAIKQQQLEDYLVNMVARLGGLMVLRDLGKESFWEVLEREPAFREVRQQFVSQGLKTVVGISLQAKERLFGVLLLGTPDTRSFTPAELRLLLALGHQIGMAIENSYLIQQTSRRSEQLHILNEIGRVLSSTLNLDELFDKLEMEMRRLLEVDSFYIALFDRAKDELHFELKVTKGRRQPRSVRPMGNHITEYILKNRQPVLITEKFDDQIHQYGVLSEEEQAGSYCGVPMVLYDRAIGVLAVHSPYERILDEGHLELLRVLASEAGIAIENARLFSEERKKSRHLMLLNNISSHAITTLNPDEMLSKIAAELDSGLHYDHIGIAILDYSAKELVIQAEAGKRRDSIGRRIKLGEGLIGEVARTGQLAIVNSADSPAHRSLLPGTLSAIALPVSYAEQLLGVLYAESMEACEFAEPEVLLLRTLADVFAGALHNALTFQKAQEQAITDGLTGVKTHRFLMEALSAEWKRSTRASRPFSLVLMDLDRFKFVNDFYGHLEGDVVLQRVGRILEQNCRRSDVVARYGGDEFVILMPETTVEQARQLANKLRGWVASDPLLRDKNITASFGIAGFPVHGSTPQELIQVADSSMYLSKHQGGNSVSSAEHYDAGEAKKWKRDVLEAYLGVTLKRLFVTGPEAFDEIYRRLEQFSRSLFDESLHPSVDQLPPAVVETVTSLAVAIDAKDQYTHGHSQKVSHYAVLVAQALQLNSREIEEIRLGALLHDVGKVGIPESILNKAGPLDALEWETMKSHTTLGDKLLSPLAAMERVRQMVRHHHEFVDGSGYPDRLEGDQIPYGARLIAIADAYDTITSERTYKKPRTPEDAFRELERCADNQFDRELVNRFIETIRLQPRPILEVEIKSEDLSPNPVR